MKATSSSSWPAEPGGNEDASGPGTETLSRCTASPADLDAELPYLYTLARRLTVHADDAHDLVQDAVVRAIPALDKVAVGSHLRAWLITILRRIHIDRIRRLAREPEIVPIDELKLDYLALAEDAAEPEAAAGSDALEQALAALPDAFRQVFVLHELEGRSYREISSALEIPLATVGTRLNRARLKLRALLAARLLERP